MSEDCAARKVRQLPDLYDVPDPGRAYRGNRRHNEFEASQPVGPPTENHDGYTSLAQILLVWNILVNSDRNINARWFGIRPWKQKAQPLIEAFIDQGFAQRLQG